MTFTHNELHIIRFALVIAQLQMKTNGAIMLSCELHDAAAKCKDAEESFERLATLILKMTTQ